MSACRLHVGSASGLSLFRNCQKLALRCMKFWGICSLEQVSLLSYADTTKQTSMMCMFADVMLQAIPLLLDCRAIASLSLCTTAVSLISESLLLVASCTHRSDTTDAAAPALPTTRTLTGQANEQQAHHAHSLHNLACMQLLPPRLMNESVMPVPSGALSMLQSTVGGPGAAEREVFAGISEKPRRGGAHQRGAARPSDNRGISATCVAIVLEASAAIERLSVQHNKKQPASTVDESAVTGALGAALKLVHMAGSVSTSGSSVHHRSLAVELYVCAAEVMEHVAVVLGSRAGEIPEMELSMKEVPTILKGSALSCSQRLLLASCEMLERACNICEGCLLEGSESTAEVQFNTQNGDRGQQNGSSKDAMLSVRGIGCWHLAVQMIQAASQCGRLSDSLGLSMSQHVMCNASCAVSVQGRSYHTYWLHLSVSASSGSGICCT